MFAGCVIFLRQEILCRTSCCYFVEWYSVKGSGPAINQLSHCQHVFAGFYLLISLPLILYTLGAFSQRWSNAPIIVQTSGVHTISVTDRDRAMGRLRHALIQPFRHRDLMTEADSVTEQRDTFSLIKSFRPRNLIIEADIGMAEHRCKNTLGRSVPVKILTDVEDDGTLEDRSPRSVCTKKAGNTCIAKIYTLTHSKQVIFLLNTVTITFVKLRFY